MQTTHDSMMISRIDGALNALRTHLVQRFKEGDWDEGHAARVTQTVLARLRPATAPADGGAEARDQGLPRELLRHSLRYINDNLDSKLTWAQIAATVRLDTFAFGRAFKRSTGITLHQYVIRRRVRRAMTLLSDDAMSITDIALEVGFSCQSHLTTLFRKYTRTTPAAFRKAARGKRRLTHPRIGGTGLDEMASIHPRRDRAVALTRTNALATWRN